MTDPSGARSSGPTSPGPTSPGDADAFHPPLGARLRHITPGDLSPETGQTSGMFRQAAVSGRTVGAEKIWMGETTVAPATASGNHHHGESETAIYVVRGNPVFVFLDVRSPECSGDEPTEVRLETKPGDYVYVPPWIPHREENPDPDNEAVVVLSRSTQDAIVVNVPSLRGSGQSSGLTATATNNRVR